MLDIDETPQFATTLGDYVAAQGEFRRYRGDYVLTENDIPKKARLRSHAPLRRRSKEDAGASSGVWDRYLALAITALERAM